MTHINKHFLVVVFYYISLAFENAVGKLSTTCVLLFWHKNNRHILQQRAFCHAVKRPRTFPFSLNTIFLWLSKEKSINQRRKCVLPFRHKNNRSVSQQIAFCHLKNYVIFPFSELLYVFHFRKSSVSTSVERAFCSGIKIKIAPFYNKNHFFWPKNNRSVLQQRAFC